MASEKASRNFRRICAEAGVNPGLFPDSVQSGPDGACVAVGLPPTPKTGDPDCFWAFRYKKSKTPECPGIFCFVEFFTTLEEFLRILEDDGYIYISTRTGNVVYDTPPGFDDGN